MNKQFSIKVQYRTTTQWQALTGHGLLAVAWQFAQQAGVFRQWQQVRYPIKTVRYTPLEKLKVLWASVVVGCAHTYELNERLGGHELALARVLGLQRFPDQSQINRLLTATQHEQVQQWRQAHLQLLVKHSRCRCRSRWLRLRTGARLLVVDIDQRGLVVQGKQFALAAPGYFGRKRGRRGYQLTALFAGGRIGELLDQYLDAGDTPLGRRLPELLDSLRWLCQRLGLRPAQVLLRGDAQLGTPALIRQVQAAGFHYLFKGLAPARAKKLLGQAHSTFWQVPAQRQDAVRWLCDLGVVAHQDCSSAPDAALCARTLLQVRTSRRPAPRPGQHRKRAAPELERRFSYYLTDLTPQQLPLAQVVSCYDARATIERYFYDEQYALGARQVRTRHFAGAALFEFVVATTNNVLRWLQQRAFGQTELARLGLGRFIRQAMQIPAYITQQGRTWLIELPLAHHLVRLLARSWPPLAAAGKT